METTPFRRKCKYCGCGGLVWKYFQSDEHQGAKGWRLVTPHAKLLHTCYEATEFYRDRDLESKLILAKLEALQVTSGP
jgi:hypothetical protein